MQANKYKYLFDCLNLTPTGDLGTIYATQRRIKGAISGVFPKNGFDYGRNAETPRNGLLSLSRAIAARADKGRRAEASTKTKI